ncbi:hypothetical protein BGZ83_003571 [Gryganskiella cystojenkinii]|nr:hypothetical protein BGZ83_003571 [Gryganskiella cystojenkinii]
MRLNPLDLPEIKENLAQYLDFETLAACILVARDWRDSFTPFLFRDLNLGLERSSDMLPPLAEISIPELQSKLKEGSLAPLIRRLVLNGNFSSHFPDLYCSRLCALSVRGGPVSGMSSSENEGAVSLNDPTVLDLLQRHAQTLTHLHLIFHRKHTLGVTNPNPTLTQSLWQVLSRSLLLLQSLTLEQVVIMSEDWCEIMQKELFPRLVKLKLICVRFFIGTGRVHEFDLTTVTQATTWPYNERMPILSKKSCSFLPSLNSRRQGLPADPKNNLRSSSSSSLPSLSYKIRDLTLDEVQGMTVPEQLELIKRCPNLETLTWNPNMKVRWDCLHLLTTSMEENVYILPNLAYLELGNDHSDRVDNVLRFLKARVRAAEITTSTASSTSLITDTDPNRSDKSDSSMVFERSMKFKKSDKYKSNRISRNYIDNIVPTINQVPATSFSPSSLSSSSLFSSWSPCTSGFKGLNLHRGTFDKRCWELMKSHPRVFLNSVTFLNVRPNNSITSAMVQDILCSCPLLESLSADWIRDTDIRGDPRPWVCSRLKRLKVALEISSFLPTPPTLCTLSNSRSSPHTILMYPKRKIVLTPKGIQIMTMIMKKFSKLVQLEILDLSCERRDWSRSSLDLRLGHGLEFWATLGTSLKQLSIRGSILNLTREDMEWMAVHWPRLQHMEADLHSKPGTAKALLAHFHACRNKAYPARKPISFKP